MGRAAVHKIRNRRCPLYRGERYRSEGEAAFAAWLDAGMGGGLVRTWRRASTITLVDLGPGRKIRYTPDFVVEWELVYLVGVPGASRVEAIDVKGSYGITADVRLRAILYAQARQLGAIPALPPLVFVQVAIRKTMPLKVTRWDIFARRPRKAKLAA